MSKHKAKFHNTMVHNLTRVPQTKREAMPKLQNYEQNSRHQADIIYLPEDPDTGHKYAVVVVDTTTRRADSRPLKPHSAAETLKAVKSIYSSNILKKPTRAMETDAGQEFKGVFHKWVLNTLGVDHKVSRVGRHRQTGLVEAVNSVIGQKILGERQLEEELATGETNRSWVSDLPEVISEYNSNKKKRAEPKSKTMKETPTLR